MAAPDGLPRLRPDLRNFGKPTTVGPRDRQVSHAMGQIVRALQAEGPMTPEQLVTVVGASYWDYGRLDRALTFAIADGLIIRTAEGLLTAV